MDYNERMMSLEYFFNCFNTVISTNNGGSIEDAREKLNCTVTSRHRESIKAAAKQLMLFRLSGNNNDALALNVISASSASSSYSSSKNRKRKRTGDSKDAAKDGNSTPRKETTSNADSTPKRKDTIITTTPPTISNSNEMNRTNAINASEGSDPNNPFSANTKYNGRGNIRLEPSPSKTNRPEDPYVLITPSTTSTGGTCDATYFSLYTAIPIKCFADKNTMEENEFQERLMESLKKKIYASLNLATWNIQVDLHTFMKKNVFCSIANLANYYKMQYPMTSLHSAKYIEQVRNILLSNVLFTLSFPLSFVPDIKRDSENTPGIGFCYYLMHYQAMKSFSVHNAQTYEPLSEDFQYRDEEFKKLIEEEIPFMQSKVVTTAYDLKNDSTIDQLLAEQLKLLLSFITNPTNISTCKFYAQETKSLASFADGGKNEEFSTWGTTRTMGRCFLQSNNVPFGMFYNDGNGDATFFGFSLNTSGPHTKHKYEVITELVLLCSNHKVGGYFNGVNHFHLIPIPTLNVTQWERAIFEVAADIADLFYSVDTIFAPLLLKRVQDLLLNKGHLKEKTVMDLSSV